MPKRSNRKNGRKNRKVEVEAWRAAPTRTIAKAVDLVRRTWEWIWALAVGWVWRTCGWMCLKVRVRSWDLVRVQAQAEAVALALARAQAEARAVRKARLSKARIAWALELGEVHKALSAWVQALEQAQVQTWLRVGALEACTVEVELGLWPKRRQDYWWLIQIITPITRLPSELLQQIFLIVIDNANDPPLVLMRVCKYWYSIITGMWVSLNLGKTTSKKAIKRKLERNQSLLHVLVDTNIDRGHLTPSKVAYQGIFAAMRATSRWRTLVVETFPAQADVSEDLVNRGLQHCPDPVMSHLRTFKLKSPYEMSPLLERLLRILGTSASGELRTVEIRSAEAVSFLVPTYSSIFRSVTVLSLDAPGLHNPVDLLPHLHQLEALTASHLPLPDYQYGADLPFVHTLRHLTLRSVSIQWMHGRTFHVLESCNIILPPHRYFALGFRATLPNCKHLSFEGHYLDIPSGVFAPKLTRLSAMCSSTCRWRGSRELAEFSNPTTRWSRLAPQILHISIEATNHAWTEALAYMSNLKELVIYNAQPSSLEAASLQSLVLLAVHKYHWRTPTPRGKFNTPTCPSLKRFGLRYRRWLRPGERFDLIPVFMSIIRSRRKSTFSMESFRIWTTSDEDDPVELIEGSSISLKGLKRLKSYAAIGGVDDSSISRLGSVVATHLSRIVESRLKAITGRNL